MNSYDTLGRAAEQRLVQEPFCCNEEGGFGHFKGKTLRLTPIDNFLKEISKKG